MSDDQDPEFASEEARQRSDVLGEDTLPVVVWEAWERRVEIPSDLQIALGLPVGILRWSRTKLERVLSDHRRDAVQIEQLSIHLRNWTKAGPQPGREAT